MKHGFVRAALITPPVKPGAVDNNKTELSKAIRAAAEKSAEIIVSGRLSISGYCCGNMFFYGDLLQGCIDALASIAADTQSINATIILGLPMKLDNRIYDCTAIINKGKILAILPQHNADTAFSEYADTTITYIKINDYDVPVGKNIIFYNTAMDYFMKFFGTDSLPDAEVILRVVAAEKTMGSRVREATACEYLSRENDCAVISLGLGRGESVRDRVYDDFKFVYECGNLISSAVPKTDNLVIGEIDVTGISHAKAMSKKAAAAKTDCLTINFSCDNNDGIMSREVSKFPMCPASEEDCMDAIDILLEGIKTRLTETKHSKVIVGLSGGLDSSHILMLCYKLFTREKWPLENIIAVTMNSPHTMKRTAKNAVKLASLLGITHIDVPILSSLKRHLKDINHTEKDTVYENAQARERAQILLDLANKNEALLIGTSNLSEICLGWSTYGGDQIAHYNPHGYLTKTAIRVLIRYQAETLAYKEAARVIKDILKTPVSPELLDGQETEKILGSYEIHDFFLYCLIAKGYSIEKTLFMSEKAFRELARKDLKQQLITFTERFFKNRFKQHFACDAPAVLDTSVPKMLSAIYSDFSAEQWIKELNNLK